MKDRSAVVKTACPNIVDADREDGRPGDDLRLDERHIAVRSALDSLLEIVTQTDEWIARVGDAQLRRAYASLLARLNHLRYGGGHE